MKGFGNKLKEIDILQIECLFTGLYNKQSKLSQIISLLEKFGFNGFIQIELNYLKNKPYVCDLIFFRN